jgi:hypothetical protein
MILRTVLLIYFGLASVFAAYAILLHDIYATTLRGTALYVGVPILVAVTCAMLLTKPLAHARPLFVSVTLSILAAAYGFEAYSWWSIRAIEGATTTPAEAAALLSSAEHPVVVAATALFFGQLETPTGPVTPVGLIPSIDTLTPTEDGYQVFHSDRYGFRNPDDVWDASKAPLALVGDSFTFGSSAAIGSSFAELLRARFSGTINLGIGGNGPLSELASVLEYLDGPRPARVIWLYYENDLEQDIFSEMRDPVLVRYTSEPDFRQGLTSRAVEMRTAMLDRYYSVPAEFRSSHRGSSEQVIPPRQRFLRWFSAAAGANPLNRLSFVTLRRTRVMLGLVQGGGDWPAPEQDFFAKILSRAKLEVEDWGGTMLFVYLPNWQELIEHDNTKAAYRNAALEAATSVGLPVLNLSEAFRAHPDTKSLFPNRRPGHYGLAGHALVAKEIERFLAARLE